MRKRKFDLESVLSYLNSIPAINSGGCGISALAIKRWIENNETEKKSIKFVYLYHRQDRVYDVNCDACKGISNFAVPFHIAIMYDRKIIDSNGINNSYVKSFTYKHIIKTEDELLQTINTPDDTAGWNSWFNRSNVKNIQKDLNIDLSDVELHNY